MRGDAAELEGVVSMVRALVEALVAYADTMREGFPANALSIGEELVAYAHKKVEGFAAYAYSYRMGEGLLPPLASEAVSVRVIEVVTFVVGIAIGLCCAYARRRRVEG